MSNIESVACLLCGSANADWSAVYRDHANPDTTYTLMRCAACSLVYLNPRPARSEVLAQSGHYQRLMSEMRAKLRASSFGRFAIQRMRKARGLGPGSGRRLLDVGCSTGEYIAYLREMGWDVQGIEFDPEAARHAREVFGLKVVTGAAETTLAQFSAQSFDIVTLWHVLEHVDDPKAVLEGIRRVLKPEGRLLLEVPNYASMWSTLLKGNWFPLEYPFHRTHFTPRTLRGILRETSFLVERLEGQPAPAETTWSLHMLWNRLRGKTWDRHLLWSPPGIVALYPLEMLLAWMGRTNHMQAQAVPSAALQRQN